VATAHDEAWDSAKRQITKGGEIISTIIVLVIVLAILWASGHGKDQFAYIVGVVVALLVGLVVRPGSAYLWSRLTFNRRQMLSGLGQIVTAIGALREPTAEQVEKAQERNRGFLTSAQGIHEELLLADERLREIMPPRSEQW
jgi:hypothetical protein